MNFCVARILPSFAVLFMVHCDPQTLRTPQVVFENLFEKTRDVEDAVPYDGFVQALSSHPVGNDLCVVPQFQSFSQGENTLILHFALCILH